MIVVPIEEENYQNYIERVSQTRENQKDVTQYQELHHIIPRCAGGTDAPENLIWLYPQEHYYVHKMLALENPSDKGLQYSWWMMSHQKHRYVTQEEYAEVRQRFSSIHSNREVSQETRKKLSDLHRGKHLGDQHWNYGKHRSQETKDKISQNRKGKYSGAENPNAKRVVCNETGEVFNTLKQAAEAFGVTLAAISNNCHGHSKKVQNKYTFSIIE